MVWQCRTEGHEDSFQGNFANNHTILLEGFVTGFTTKSYCAKLDGNLQLQFTIAAKVDAMI